MKCPRCVQIVTPAVMCCPHCGFSLDSACALYGGEAVVAQRLMDIEGLLTPESREALLGDLAAFDSRFPQLFFLMYVGPLPPPASPRQFAFWLLNHAAVEDADAFRPNERGLLLVVDPRGGNAVLAGGYFIEHLVTQEELDKILKKASHDLSLAAYPSALRTITQEMGSLLKHRAITVAKKPERLPAFPLEAPPAFPSLVRTGESAPAHGTSDRPAQQELPLEPPVEQEIVKERKPRQKRSPAGNLADLGVAGGRDEAFPAESQKENEPSSRPAKGQATSRPQSGTKRITPRRRR